MVKNCNYSANSTLTLNIAEMVIKMPVAVHTHARNGIVLVISPITPIKPINAPVKRVIIEIFFHSLAETGHINVYVYVVFLLPIRIPWRLFPFPKSIWLFSDI